MKIYVVGSINMDLVISADVLPQKGETLTGYGFMTNPGGKGANQAVACGKLGGDVEMVGCVGKEFGEQLQKTLQGYGVGTKYVWKKEEVSSGIAVIVVSQGDNRIILDQGANALLDRKQVEEALGEAKEGDVLITQLEVPLETVAFALECAKSKKMTTILNPAPAKPLPKELFAYVDYFIPNQTETGFYSGIVPQDAVEAQDAAEKLFAMGVKNVVVTLGEKGSVACSAQGAVVAPAFRVQAVDTTAAGDTFVGAFATRLTMGDDVASAMTYANKAASITVQRKGAQQAIPTKGEF